jgi:hypothetical protein
LGQDPRHNRNIACYLRQCYEGFPPTRISGSTNRNSPESPPIPYNLNGYQTSITHRLSVWNIPNITSITTVREQSATSVKIDEFRSSVNTVCGVIKKQLESCIFVPTIRGFDKRFYPIVDHSASQMPAEGLTKQAETIAESFERQELNLYLKKLGIREDRIMIVENGKKCVEIFENKNKNKKQRENDNDDVLVILDIHLKDTSSFHVAKEIMNINPRQKMILTSTSSLKDVKDIVKDVSTSIEENMTLIRPFRLDELLSVIKTITAN